MVWSGIQFLFYHYGKDFILAMVTSTIFYLMVVYFPTKKANKNTKDFIQEFYKKIKREIILQICWALKIHINNLEMNNNLMRYDFFRENITDDNMSQFTTFNDKKIKQIAEEINYSLNQLQIFISYELSQSYIREDEFANKRLRYL